MTKKLTISALLVALAMIFSYVEVLIPFNFGIPGIKLGLANLVVVVALYLLDAKQALIISVVRILLHLRQYGRTALQYCRRSSELRRDGALPEDQRPVHHGRQRCRRYQPQHRPDSRCRLRGQESEPALLSAGADDCRHHHRFSHWSGGRSDYSFCEKSSAALICRESYYKAHRSCSLQTLIAKSILPSGE